jgi:transketolase N-terminal domain/subunit
MTASYIHSQNKVIKMLEQKATKLREEVIDMLLAAGSGHSAGSLGTADMFAALSYLVCNTCVQRVFF